MDRREILRYREIGCRRRLLQLYAEFLLRQPRHGSLAPCAGSQHPQWAGTFNAISGLIDWQFAPKWDLYGGLVYSKVNSGLANGYIERDNIDPTAGLRLRF